MASAQRPRLPSLRLNMVVAPTATMSELWQFVHDVLVRRPDFKPSYWRLWSDRSPGLTGGEVAGAPPLDALLQRGAAAFAAGFEVQDAPGAGLMVCPVASFASNPVEIYDLHEGWRVWSLTGSYDEARDYFAQLELYVDVLRGALDRFDVLRADVQRTTYTCIAPTPPLVDPEELARVVRVDDVADAYGAPDQFWKVWDHVEHRGDGKALCTRALAVADELEFKRRTMTDGFALGRVAKPGATGYYAANPSSEEETWLRGLPRRLTQVGYDAATRTLELTAVTEPGEHLTPADLLDLLDYLSHGTADGQNVDLVVVSFPDERSARAEVGPLRDIGSVRVQYFAQDGTWAVLAS